MLVRFRASINKVQTKYKQSTRVLTRLGFECLLISDDVTDLVALPVGLRISGFDCFDPTFMGTEGEETLHFVVF